MSDKPQTAQLKAGIVSAIEGYAVRVKLDDLDGVVSPAWPCIVTRAQDDKAWHPPDIGAQVACICDENLETGFVLGEIYSEADQPPTDNPKLWHWTMRDGSLFEFDPESGKLTISVTGEVSVKSAVSITLDAPKTKVTGDMTIDGALSQGEKAGGSTTFGGDLKAKGSMHADKDITAGETSLQDHTHVSNGPGAETNPPS